jgi:hypothetical protein
MAALGWNLAPAGRMRHAESSSPEATDSIASTAIEQAPLTLPYGVAIAAGGLAVVAQLIKL